MVDDDFMLAPLAADWLLDNDGRARAEISFGKERGRPATRRRAREELHVGGGAHRRLRCRSETCESRWYQRRPAFADRETQSRFDNSAYHGTVVWSWQQAVLAAGLSRQLARTDLSADLRTRLQSARAQLWKEIEATNALRSSELWTWSFANGQYHPEAFGQQNAHVGESNAAQLWSTVDLSFQNGEWLGARRAQ